MQQLKNKRRARTTVLSATVLCTAIGSAFAVDVDNEADYNTALDAGGTINITGSGFNISAPPMVPTSNVSIVGHSGMPVLNGNGGTYGALTLINLNGPYLTLLKDLAIENFGQFGVTVASVNSPPNPSDFLVVDNVRFANNAAGLVIGYPNASISNSKFINNHELGLMALDFAGTMSGNVFTNNHNNTSMVEGSAISFINSLSGMISGNTFTDNRTAENGGAIYVENMQALGILSGNVFIDNYAEKNGGALAIVHNGTGVGEANIRNNTFLGNRADIGGGAIYHHAGSQDTVLTIGADAGKRTVFYGNNTAIYMNGDTGSTTTLNIDAAANGTVFLLDSSAGSSSTKTSVNVSGSGNVYLGGNHTVYGVNDTWVIGNGAKVWGTVVEYEAGSPLGSWINLAGANSSFTLDSGAALNGDGVITASTITLKGTIQPSWVEKTGIYVADIHSTSTAADIDVAQTSPFGSLFLNGGVTMDGATYIVNASSSGNSRIVVETGNLTFDNTASTLQVYFAGDGAPALNNVTVLETLDGTISDSGSYMPTAIAGGSLQGYLVTGNGTVNLVDSNKLQISMDAPTLSWNDTTFDAGSNQFTLAHGDFDLGAGQTYTIDSDLENHDQITGGGVATSGWDGKSLTKTGLGKLVLNGNNTYTGATDVQAGTLIVGGTSGSTAQVDSKVKVAAGATIGGHGFLDGGLNLASGAFIAPGNSIGTITIAGDLNLNGVTYQLEISADGSSDKIVVNQNTGTGEAGDVSLAGGILDILPFGSGNWPGVIHYADVIKANDGTVSGEFATVNNHLAFMTHELDYQANAVHLTMRRLGLGSWGALCTWCQSDNQRAVYQGITLLPDAHPVVGATLGMSRAQAQASMDNLSGEIYASTRSALLSNYALRDAMRQRMQSRAALPSDERLWVSTWGLNGRTSGNDNAVKTKQSGFGLALGADFYRGEKVAAGAVLAYEDGRVKSDDNRRSRSDIDAYSLGVWVAGDASGVQLRGGAAYSHLTVDTKRNITVPGLQGTAKAKQRGSKVQIFAEAAVPFDVSESFSLSPFVGITHSWLRTRAARESGSLAALDVRAQTDSVTQATLGVRASYAVPDTSTEVSADLGWGRVFGDAKSQTSNRFIDAGQRFKVQGVDIDKNSVVAGLSVHTQIAPSTSLGLGYQGQMGSKTRNHTANLQLKIQF